MQKVEMLVSGKRALVDSDMVKKMVRKDMLVATARDLQNKLKDETDPVCVRLLNESLGETMGKIIRLNRTIRSTVQFIKE